MEAAKKYKKKKNNANVPESSREFGKRIKAVRKTLKLTQSQMAKKLKFVGSYLSEIENGKANPNYNFFFSLTNHYRVSMDFLFHGKGEMFLSHEIVPLDDQDNDKYIDEVETIEDLIWFFKRSSVFQLEMLNHANQFLIEKEATIKKNIARRQARKKKE